jgi:hypothetical protein
MLRAQVFLLAAFALPLSAQAFSQINCKFVEPIKDQGTLYVGMSIDTRNNELSAITDSNQKVVYNSEEMLCGSKIQPSRFAEVKTSSEGHLRLVTLNTEAKATPDSDWESIGTSFFKYNGKVLPSLFSCKNNISHRVANLYVDINSCEIIY